LSSGKLVVVNRKAEQLQQKRLGPLARPSLDIGKLVPAGLRATPVHAQHEVTGEVVDAENGSPLPGVNIVVNGTQIGTTTRSNGTYTIEAPSPTDTLVFSFVGYQQQEVPIDGREEINVTLESAVTAMDEVVVQVGYEERTVETVTGSVSQVSGSDLEVEPTNNITQMLQGTVPGLVGVQETGRPGMDDSNLLIRGSSTLNDNDPLIVIDGVPGRQGGLARLNPSDIESISVLKDASAAIYGSRAANGVILVTTKRGTSTGETQVSARVRQSYAHPTIVPDMADAPTFMQMLNEVDRFRDNAPRFSGEEIERHRNCPEGSYECFNTNWYDEALRDFAPRTMANVSVMGGGEALQYRISLRGVTEEGILVNSGTGYDQLGFRSNFDGQVTENLTLSLNLHGRLEDRNTPAWTRGLNSAWEMLQRGFPTDPAFWPDGSPGPAQEQGVNPVVANRTGYDDQKSYFFQSNLTAQMDIPAVEGWSVEGTVAYDQQADNNRRWQKPWTLYNFGGFDESGEPVLVANGVGVPDPQLDQFVQNDQDILLRGTTRYEAFTGSHSGSLLLGTEYEYGVGRFTQAFRRFFSTEQIQELFAGGTQEQSIDGNSWHSTRLNFFGRASYSYDDRYLLEFVGRYDGSYIFPEGDRYGLFPSVSAGWNIARENWFANATEDFFDRLQLRSSFGQTGNDNIEPYQFLRAYGFTGDFVTGEGNSSSLEPIRVPNPDITWEVATQFDVGVNGSILDDRLSFETTYFNHFRDDILWFRSESVPGTAGFTLPRENLAEVRSRGLEGEVQYAHQFSEDVTLRVGGNMSWAKDEIKFFDEPEGRLEWQQAEGKPMNTELFYVSDGIFRDQEEIDNTPSWPGARPGDVKFRDIDGDGDIDGEDRVRQDVNDEPDLIGSFHVGATLQQFDARIQLQGATRVHQYVFTSNAGEFGNYFQEFAEERWRPSPDNVDEPHPDHDFSGPRAYNRQNPYWASNQNTHFLQDASYLRLRSARLGYRVPSEWTQSFGIDQLRIDLTGRNLLTWSPLKIMDPEIRNGAAHTYPPERTFSVELQVDF